MLLDELDQGFLSLKQLVLNGLLLHPAPYFLSNFSKENILECLRLIFTLRPESTRTLNRIFLSLFELISGYMYLHDPVMTFKVIRVIVEARRIIKFSFIYFTSFEMAKGQISTELGLRCNDFLELVLDHFNLFRMLGRLPLGFALCLGLEVALSVFRLLQGFFPTVYCFQVIFNLEEFISALFPC